jgi:uncharacterized MAPEG superfamily protein
MTVLIGCLIIAVLFPYLTKLPLAYAMHQSGRYDNNYPRTQQSTLKGFGARALGAHQNSFEALIVFATAVLTAIATHHTSNIIQGLAIFYIVSRIIYYVFYFADFASLRSLLWALGYFSCLIMLGYCLIS